MLRRTLCLILLICTSASQGIATPRRHSNEADAPEIVLATQGVAALPITISPSASAQTVALARELTQALGRITGAAFTVTTSSDARGIVLGSATDWPGVVQDIEPGFSPVFAKEDYVIRTEPLRLLLVGRTDLGAQNAVWDFLHRIGFRQFFPGAKWEVWPRAVDLKVRFDIAERPDFYSRNIGLRMNPHPLIGPWEERNRANSGFLLRAQHMYGALIKRNPTHFKQFPNDIIPADKDRKFDTSSPTLQDLAVRDSVRLLSKNRDWDSISMEPSDGGNWRQDSPLGSPSNQAVTLANHVARSLREIMPERGIKVGLLAYHEHSPAPTIEVDRDVIVRVATAYISGGYTAEELLKAWQEKGASTGVSEFMSIWSWDYGLPGRTRASDIGYLGKSISNFHSLGARHWNAQSSSSWGPEGLGYYVASRLLWNVDEPVDAILSDFYTKAFPSASEEMRVFYETGILKSGKALFSGDLIGRMYRTLRAALGKTSDPTERERIFDLALYVRYLDLVFSGRSSSGDERQQRADELFQLVARYPEATFLNTKLPVKRSPISNVKAEAPVEVLPPYSEAEVIALIDEGAKRFPAIDFKTVGFTSDLVPFPAKESESHGREVTVIGTNQLYLYPNEKKFRFSISGARLYRTKGPVKLRLIAEQNVNVNEVIAEAEVPADREQHEVTLESLYDGLHRLQIVDGGGGTTVSWPKGQRVAIPSSPDESVKFVSSSRNQFSFYVPTGTEVVGGYSTEASGRLRAPDGHVLLNFEKEKGPGYFSVPVPKGMDGKTWEFVDFRGNKLLLTVPPWMARGQSELLVPQEVLDSKDSLR